MAAALPLVGSGEPLDSARHALEAVDAVMVIEDGKPVGVLTRHDLLGFFAS
jgi:cystathionine beta-synthase